MSFATRLVAHWYRAGLTPLTAALTPFALIFGALAALRRALYRAGWLRATRLGVPVVVVGNVTVGGTGKTPLVRALVEALRAEGCDVLDKVDDSEYGVFGWVIDPEGNKVELWQPPPGQ